MIVTGDQAELIDPTTEALRRRWRNCQTGKLYYVRI